VHNCLEFEVVKPKRKGFLGKHRMTVVIGAKCIGGVILYADRNVIGTDGSKREGDKIWLRDLPQGLAAIAIASATDDAVASENLAKIILDDFEKATPTDFRDLTSRVREHLRTWNEPYNEELSISYLLAASLAGEAKLYLLQPRNKVIEIPQRYAIGAGATVAEPLFDSLLPENTLVLPEMTLMRMAYMVRHAKEQVAFVGGGSNAVYVPNVGSTRWINSTELRTAEEMAQFVDETLGRIAGLMLSLTNRKDAEATAKILCDLIAETTVSIGNAVRFSAFG